MTNWKKRFKRTAKHGSTQYAMSETSYKPANEETNNSVNIVKFTPQQQQNKTPEQLFLHVSNFMKDKIETLAKKSSEEQHEPKRHQIAQQCKWSGWCLVELVNKECDENFSTLEAMHKYMEEKAMNQKKKCADDSSEEEYVEEEE